MKLLLEYGNANANQFWEAKDVNYQRDGSQPISRPIREYFITQKYVHKTYTEILLGQDESNLLLLESCKIGDVSHVYIALCNNANPNSKTIDTLQTPLHICCLDNYLLCAELLCIWNGNVTAFDEIDAEGKTAENIAKERQFVDMCGLINAYKNRT